MMMYLLTFLTIYMIQINQNIYNDYNHKERVRTSGIDFRPSSLKWKKGKKVSSMNKTIKTIKTSLLISK